MGSWFSAERGWKFPTEGLLTRNFLSVLVSNFCGVIVERHTMLTISMCLQWIWSDFGKETTRRLSLLVMLFILTPFFASVDNRCKLFICPKALRWSLFYVLSCYGQISGSSGLAFYRLAGSNSRLLKSIDSKTVSTTECLYLLYHYHVISKGYRPSARGYVMPLLLIFFLFFNTPSWHWWYSQVSRHFNYVSFSKSNFKLVFRRER